MLRITPDTNVLVRGTLSPEGAAGRLLAAWVAGDVALVTCLDVVSEFEEVLTRAHIRNRYRHITAHAAAAAATLRRNAVLVSLTEVPPVVAQDPDDDVVLACAVSGGVDFIITGDHHLLGLRIHQGIPILTAEGFLPILRSGVREEQAAYVVAASGVWHPRGGSSTSESRSRSAD